MNEWFAKISCAQLNVFPPIVELGVGAAQPSGTIAVPLDIDRKSTSVRSDRATFTAPSILREPAPCLYISAPAIGFAVYCRSILIMFGVRFGFASRRSAAAPETIGTDMDVPLIRIILSASGVRKSAARFRPGFSSDIWLPGALCEMILFPGATRSGLIRLS